MNQCNDTNNDFYALFADGELIVSKELGFLHTLDFAENAAELLRACLLYTSPSPRDLSTSRMPSSA